MNAARQAQDRVLSWLLATGALVSTSTASGQWIPVFDLDPAESMVNERPYRTLHGTTVGTGIESGVYPDDQAVLWDASGPRVLPLLPGLTGGYASALNSAGVVVGAGFDFVGPVYYAVIVWTDGVPVDLETLVTGGDPIDPYEALDIDDHGRIVGTAHDEATGFVRPFLFDSGIMTDLGSLDGGMTHASAVALNGRGAVVGVSTVSRTSLLGHAILWEAGQVIDLHDPLLMTGGESFAIDVDRAGRVVGWYLAMSGATKVSKAVLWDHGSIVDLAAAVTGDSRANGINDFGVVVGRFDAGGGSFHAFKWEAGAFDDLNALIDPTLGWILTDAFTVDNEGRIAGTGLLHGAHEAFLLEPDCNGSYTVYGSGCAGSGGVEPQLIGTGCPAPERDFALLARDGLASGIGLLLVGSGNGSVQVKPGCNLQVLPLALAPLPVTLDPLGELWLPARLPAGTASFDLYLQLFGFDAGAPDGISATKPVQVHFE